MGTTKRRRWFAHPRLEALERLVLPTVSLGPITIGGGPAVEGGTITVSGTATVIDPIGSAQFVIDWADGSPPDVRAATFGSNVPFSFSHVVQDDNPTGTPVDTVNVSVRLDDTGPRTLTSNADGGSYKAYDVPGLHINLGNALDTVGAAKSGVKSAGLDNANDAVVTVPLTGTFRFYGSDFTAVNVTDNGLLSFNGQITTGINSSLSSASKIALICPFWDDLQTNTGLSGFAGDDRVLTRSVNLDGEGGDDYFIIEWSRVPHVGNDKTKTATFQVLLQMNTGSTNGDIIFNYIDTDFGNSAIDFGASATIGIQSGSTAQTGVTALNSFGLNLFKSNQAVRFSTQDIQINRAVGPEGFGYSAYPMPFESQLDLMTAPVAPATPNGNVRLLGGAGTFNDISANAAGVLGPTDTFNFYGKLFDVASTINASDNGLLVFNGNDTTSLNGNLTSIPASGAIATLWDAWSGAAVTSSVFGRVIDFDGDGVGEFLCVEWSDMQNDGALNNPATWQALLELNTGVDDPGDIYINYRDTTVGNKNFDAGASATVGIKDAGVQGARRLVVPRQTNGTNFADGKAVGIFQTSTPPQTATVTISNVSPTLDAGSDVTINEGDLLTRSILISDASGSGSGLGDSFNYTINFGDGTAIQSGTVGQGSRSFLFSHYYADDGKYPVTITCVDDDTGAASPAKFNVSVLNVSPTVTLPPAVAAGILVKPQQLVTIPTAASFSDPGFTYAPAGTKEVFTTKIEWGDGNSSVVNGFVGNPGSGGIPTTGSFGGKHVYLLPGTFTVTVTVTDDDGGSSSKSFIIGVGSPHLTVYGADAGGGPMVVAYDTRGLGLTLTPAFSFFAYDSGFRGGVRVASADINGDSLADIITAAGPGGGPHVKVFDGATGDVIFSFFAYGAGFAGGVYVASGDVNHDGVPDIVTGAGAGGGPHVKVFDGKTGQEIRSFFAYDAGFHGGVRVAAADVNGDGFADIITGAGPGGGPHVRVFDGKTGAILNEFFAYPASFAGGVNVTAGDINNDGQVEIITGPGVGGGPLVRIFPALGGQLTTQFNAFPPGFPGSPPPVTSDQLWSSGVYVGVTDLNNDGVPDLVVGPGAGRISKVRLFNGPTLALANEYTVFDPAFLGGAFVGGN
jgi:PKD domain/FG-GAP-like repeat